MLLNRSLTDSYKRTLSAIDPSSSIFAIGNLLLLLRRQESDLATTIATALDAGKNIYLPLRFFLFNLKRR